jgi:hypothetical protein
MADQYTPKVGEEVEVVLRNPSAIDRQKFPGNDTIVFHGTVIGGAPYDPKDSFRITGDTLMPFRVISRSMVLSCNGKKVKQAETFAAPTAKHFSVKGSKGTDYTVTISENGKASCVCAGFGFRKTCSHVDAVLKQLGSKA